MKGLVHTCVPGGQGSLYADNVADQDLGDNSGRKSLIISGCCEEIC